MIDIRIKRLTESAVIPTKAHDSDACFDIYYNLQRAYRHLAANPYIRRSSDFITSMNYLKDAQAALDEL